MKYIPKNVSSSPIISSNPKLKRNNLPIDHTMKKGNYPIQFQKKKDVKSRALFRMLKHQDESKKRWEEKKQKILDEERQRQLFYNLKADSNQIKSDVESEVNDQIPPRRNNYSRRLSPENESNRNAIGNIEAIHSQRIQSAKSTTSHSRRSSELY
jgi:uncharacterized membrane-anchored protein YjiN (DUF445 family)